MTQAAAQDGKDAPGDLLAPVRRLILADPAAQERLLAAATPEVFLPMVEDFVGAHGVSIDRAVLAAAIQPDLLGLGRWQPAPVTCEHWPGEDWLPVRSVPAPNGLTFDWARFGPEPLQGPFYEDDVRRVAPRPFNQMVRTRTALGAMIAGAAAEASPAPAGFIFHISRCGSTLAAKMLAAPPHHHVVAEAEPIDAVVTWARSPSVPPAAAVSALRAVISALARHRRGRVQRFFVKLDAWHAPALPLFHAAFPDVPWLFLYRDPLEVLVSHGHQPGLHVVPGTVPASLLGIAPLGGALEEQAAQAWARIAEAALDHRALGRGLLVNYVQLADAMAERIPAHFGFIPDAAESRAMRAASRFDAKQPDAPFRADASMKRASASAAQRAAAERLRPLYERLESVRDGAA